MQYRSAAFAASLLPLIEASPLVTVPGVIDIKTPGLDLLSGGPIIIPAITFPGAAIPVPNLKVTPAVVAVDLKEVNAAALTVQNAINNINVPSVPNVGTPGLPSIPSLPGFTLPTFPTLPGSNIPTLPVLPTLPGLPALPGIPVTPGLPNLVTTLASLYGEILQATGDARTLAGDVTQKITSTNFKPIRDALATATANADKALRKIRDTKLPAVDRAVVNQILTQYTPAVINLYKAIKDVAPSADDVAIQKKMDLLLALIKQNTAIVVNPKLDIRIGLSIGGSAGTGIGI